MNRDSETSCSIFTRALQEKRRRPVDVARAEGQSPVARPGQACEIRSALVDRRCPRDVHPGSPLSERIHDELAADAVDGLLACRVHVGHGDDVRVSKRGCELVCEMSRAGVEMRLEEHEQAPAVT